MEDPAYLQRLLVNVQERIDICETRRHTIIADRRLMAMEISQLKETLPGAGLVGRRLRGLQGEYRDARDVLEEADESLEKLIREKRCYLERIERREKEGKPT